nr:AMP-binding protein [Agrobacterium sp. rho-8.1]
WRIFILPDAKLDVHAFAEFILENKITFAFMTTALFDAMADVQAQPLATLKYLWTGGEAVPSSAVKTLLSNTDGLELRDVYGPTETTTFATSYLISLTDTNSPLP